MRFPPVAGLWATPAWRRTKLVADRALIAAVAAAVAWAGVTAVFTVRRATTNRALAAVHLAGQPVTFRTLAGAKIRASAHPVVLFNTTTEIIGLSVTNDSPDGVTLAGPPTLTGPYLAGPVELTATGGGYIIGGGTVQLRGRVTVDCAAAALTTAAALSATMVTGQAPTQVTLIAVDADNEPHPTTLVIDTTALAVQSQVCRS